MYRRRKRRHPFAAYAALAFNLLICVTPFLAARTLFIAFGEEHLRTSATDESVDATKAAIDGRFERLARRNGGQDRDTWAEFVGQELEAGDMPAVRGLLLAAPQMLAPDEAESLQARIAVADGGGPQVAISAALSYLPEPLQAEYARRSAPLSAQFDTAEASEADPAAASGDDGYELSAGSMTVSASQFSVLGDLRDLSLQAARWTRNGEIDEFAFTLSGIGLILADDDSRNGASIALSAKRAESLDPDFVEYLERKLYLAAPPQRLKRQLSAKLQHEFGYVTDGPGILEDVFRSSADAASLELLLSDLRLINDIAQATSPMSAVTMLSLVRNSSDLRRAKLVSQAGGDKAVALAQNDPGRLLNSAKTVIEWTPALMMQAAALFACCLLLIIVSCNVLFESIRRSTPQRRSAVYQLEEMVSS